MSFLDAVCLVNDDVGDADAKLVLASRAVESALAPTEFDQVSLRFSIHHHVNEVTVLHQIALGTKQRYALFKFYSTKP